MPATAAVGLARQGADAAAAGLCRVGSCQERRGRARDSVEYAGGSSTPPLDFFKPGAPRPGAADLVDQAARDRLVHVDAAGAVARQRVPPLLDQRRQRGGLLCCSLGGGSSRRRRQRRSADVVIRVEEENAAGDADPDRYRTVESQSARITAGQTSQCRL